MELALINCPSVKRYYFVLPELCIFTVDEHIFEIYANEKEQVTWSNNGYLQFLIFDLDDGFLFWTFCGEFRPNTIKHMNESFKKWKYNGMQGEILIRDDWHLLKNSDI